MPFPASQHLTFMNSPTLPARWRWDSGLRSLSPESWPKRSGKEVLDVLSLSRARRKEEAGQQVGA